MNEEYGWPGYLLSYTVVVFGSVQRHWVLIWKVVSLLLKNQKSVLQSMEYTDAILDKSGRDQPGLCLKIENVTSFSSLGSSIHSAPSSNKLWMQFVLRGDCSDCMTSSCETAAQEILTTSWWLERMFHTRDFSSLCWVGEGDMREPFYDSVVREYLH